ncbi:predicted protein [Postia placenta Mad-698-R]|nr:predicted protein [Postia placenta Mad-698-R]
MSQPISDALLTQILGQLEALQVSQQALQAKLDALAHPASPVSSPQYNTIAIPTHHPDSSLSSIAPTAISPSGPLSHGQSTTSTSAVGTGSDNGVIGDKERERLLYPGRVLLTNPITLIPVGLCLAFRCITNALRRRRESRAAAWCQLPVMAVLSAYQATGGQISLVVSRVVDAMVEIGRF